MTCDQPLTFYTEKKHTKKEMDTLAAEWEESHKIQRKEGEKIKLSDILGGKQINPEDICQI